MLDILLKQFAEFAFCLWLIYLFGNLFFDRQRKHRKPPMDLIDPLPLGQPDPHP